MATFTDYSDILPDPSHEIGKGGELDLSTGLAGPGFAGVKLISVEPLLRYTANSQIRESQAAYHHKWGIDITYNPLTCEQFHVVLAFLLYKQYTMQSFYVSLPQFASQGIADMPVNSTKLAGNSVITIDGTGVLPGMLFTQDNAPAHTKAYMVTRVETNTNYLTGVTPVDQPNAGDERLHFTPALHEDILATDTLDFTDPLIKVRQIGNVTYALDKNGLFNYSLRLEEVRT